MTKRVPMTKKFATWMKQVGEEESKNFKLDSSKIFCNVCCKMYPWSKKSELDQHIQSKSHKKAVSLQASTHERQSLVNVAPLANEYHADLCKAFLSADIPLLKLDNPHLKAFLEKYTKRVLPSETHLRTTYLSSTYNQVIKTIREEAENSKIWMAVDETTDKCGRFIVNVLIGCLRSDDSGKPHLLMSREVERANNVTISQLAMDALHFLWPGRQEADINKSFVVFLSDGANYMVKAGKVLKMTYPDLVHVTCLAHALHRVAEAVRGKFKDVDKLLASIKAVFKKTTSRKRAYKEALPDLPLPPEPVITRWGTWLDSADFCAKNYEAIKTVIGSFDEDDAASIKSARKLLEKDSVKNELADISANYAFLSGMITNLEERNIALTAAMKIISDVDQRLKQNESRTGIAIYQKLQSVLEKNPGYGVMLQISKVLSGDTSAKVNMDPGRMAALKFCPVTSVEVERSFSMENAILRPTRRNFSVENLEMYVVCHYELTLM